MSISSKASRTSVIIPAYNCGDTLGWAVKSAVEQDPAPLQVLVVVAHGN
jgi:glycosyltransferase involved in cell wall biosynthesis